jgi:CspA family cold shock protein
MTAVAPKQVAAAKATLKRVIHMSRSLMIAGGSATGLSGTGAWIVRVLWPMMVARLRLIRAIVQGSSTFIVDPIALLNPLREPRTVPMFELGLVCRADLVRLHPKGNADFGWAVARRSCGRDQVCADKEAKMATGTVKWFNPTKGYGFIQPQDGGRDVFVHISAVERAGLSFLNEGQTVDYELVSNRGKESADNLKAR